MSPVEKQVVIPLEYHRIENELSEPQIICNLNEFKTSIHQVNNNNNDKFNCNIKEKAIEIENENNEIYNEIYKSSSSSLSSASSSSSTSTNSSVNSSLSDSTKINDDSNKSCHQPKCDRNRQIFGIQLEVTNLLLEAERRKLDVLQRELKIALEDNGSVEKAKENIKHELIVAINRIQSQYDVLEKEYKQHAIGRLRNSKIRGTGKSNRSQPAIGLKQTPKARPTIFGTVAYDQSPKDNVNKRALPQTTSGACSSSLSSSAVLKKSSTNDKQAIISSQHQQQQQQSSQCDSSTIVTGPALQSDNRIENNLILATEENSLVYRDGNLVSGPLDALIQHMVPTSDYYPDRSYIFAFLLSARLFIQPYKLLERICQLCEEQQNFKCKTSNNSNCSSSSSSSSGLNNDSNLFDKNDCDHSSSSHQQYQQQQQKSKQHHQQLNKTECSGKIDTDSIDGECCKKLKQFANNFVQLLTEWIDTFPYDFRDERLMQNVRLMTKKCIYVDNDLRKNVSAMLQNLLNRLTILEQYEEFLQTISNETTTTTTTTTNVGNNSNNSNASISGGGSTTKNFPYGTYTMSSSLANQIPNLSSTNTTTTVNSSNPMTGLTAITIPATNTSGSGINTLLSSSSSSHNTNSSSSSSSLCLSSVDISELCPNPALLAHQLTHIELERLSHIGPEEFVQAFAKENPNLEQSFNDMKKTRNLESYVQWFNRLSYFVATEIVKHSKKKQRVRVVEYWIETGRECFNIGNFNSLMAIIAGLNMSPISRLKKTWAKVQSAKFSVLEHQMDPTSNFNSYRSTLKAAMWRSAGATDERERIVIPFFSLLVKDLYFLNEGCSNKLENGHVNFEKFWQLAKQVTEFIAWKQVTCPFEKIPKVIMFLYTNNILNENTLALASFECEPPENHEKDRYKCLKSEHQNHHNNHH